MSTCTQDANCECSNCIQEQERAYHERQMDYDRWTNIQQDAEIERYYDELLLEQLKNLKLANGEP